MPDSDHSFRGGVPGSRHHVTSVKFHNYKAFRDFSVSFQSFNILVGPNNAGKSTIVGAFRILAEAIRRARSRNPTYLQLPQGQGLGYSIDFESTGIAGENVFYDYDDSEPASVSFRFSNGNKLILFFPETGVCTLACETNGPTIRSTSQFKSEFNIQIGFVPVLGPVDHNEQLYKKEAARLALVTRGAARNFRNIWHHYPEHFPEFRSMVQTTWPGMDIGPPELDYSHTPPRLRMFCPEERIPREIYWAGFGFQVWCQMLTHIVKNDEASLFLIDEPDIYLHSDLQRQLLAILKTLGPDIVIATHSTELIAEADPNDILIVNKKFPAARRIKDPGRLVSLFQTLGSNLNPTLTQLARTRRVVFVEGKDFQVISRFARILGITGVANRTGFAVVPAEGFNPTKVRDFKQGIESTLGSKIAGAVIFDRDYRSDTEVEKEISELQSCCDFVRIHDRKELENFLLVEAPIARAIQHRLNERARRSGEQIEFVGNVRELLLRATEQVRHKVESRFLAKRRSFVRSIEPSRAETSIDEELLREFEATWAAFSNRLLLVPGKDVLARLNQILQDEHGVTVSVAAILGAFTSSDVPLEMKALVEDLDRFCKST